MTARFVPDAAPVPITEISRRLSHLQKALQQKGIDGALIVQRVDLLYFSGTAQDGALYVPSHGEPTLFIKRYFPRARKESPLNQIVPVNAFRDIPGRL
ncbi:MAG: aminopeptidase P family N-terminal domain-containing protein, partial [Deltaproteobacteria bacterium]|nr:aminopeptidase P family N-terminal domain-containing protein [Deltaproteobacteria bacterium]